MIERAQIAPLKERPGLFCRKRAAYFKNQRVSQPSPARAVLHGWDPPPRATVQNQDPFIFFDTFCLDVRSSTFCQRIWVFRMKPQKKSRSNFSQGSRFRTRLSQPFSKKLVRVTAGVGAGEALALPHGAEARPRPGLRGARPRRKPPVH